MIETKRLELYPLDERQLALWINNISKLEEELECSYRAEPMEGIFLEIVKGQLEITKSDCVNYRWHSFWFMIRKSDRVVVGSADFKKTPDVNADVEIGYGLGKEYEHNGYMTEAVQAMCKWALEQEGVSHVIAETEVDGYASQRVLRRCGFKEQTRNETVWWLLE